MLSLVTMWLTYLQKQEEEHMYIKRYVSERLLAENYADSWFCVISSGTTAATERTLVFWARTFPWVIRHTHCWGNLCSRNLVTIINWGEDYLGASSSSPYILHCLVTNHFNPVTIPPQYLKLLKVWKPIRSLFDYHPPTYQLPCR